MKKVAGTLKIDQAQFRELESFTKFGGDLDSVTAFAIDKGKKNTELLVQPQYAPMPVEEQIAILYCGTNGLLKDIPVEQVREFERTFLQILRNNHQDDVLKPLRNGQFDMEVATIIEKVAGSIRLESSSRT